MALRIFIHHHAAAGWRTCWTSTVCDCRQKMRKFRHYSWQFIHYLKNRFFIDLNVKINGYIICQTSVWDSSYNLFALDKMSGVICGSALLWQKAAYWSLPRLGNETQPVTQKTHLWNKPKAGWRWVNSLNTIFNLKVRASAQLYMSLTKTVRGGVLQVFFGDVLRIFFFAFIRWNHLSLFPMTWSVLVSCWKGES